MSRILGAILNGGQSRRFGSPKALAVIAGKRLIDHVAQQLRPQVAALIVVGGPPIAPYAHAPDCPAPGLGPLGGLLGALRAGQTAGFEYVVTAPCDALHMPADWVARLRAANHPQGAIVVSVTGPAPTFGLWPVSLADALADFVGRTQPGRSLSLAAWVDQCGTQPEAWSDPAAFANINRPEDVK